MVYNLIITTRAEKLLDKTSKSTVLFGAFTSF